MIATVRIAPYEKWCKRAQAQVADLPDEQIADCIPVTIETRSMEVLDGERVWLVLSLPADVEMFGGKRVCEHMLEMD